MKLTAAKVAAIEKTGRYSDGAGLYFMVTKRGSRSWAQRVTVDGRKREKGLGPYPKVNLSQARRIAAANRDAVRSGRNPFEKAERAEPEPRTMTFAEAADAWYDTREAGWKSDKYKANVKRFLETAKDAFGAAPVDEIANADVQAMLRPIWRTKHESARSVMERTSAVFRWCIGSGLMRYNPADGAADVLGVVDRQPKHMKALDWRDVPAALAKIRAARFYPTMAWPVTTLCFELLVLTATRGGDVRGATWNEFDLDAGVWTIPPARMKMSRPHRVPLSRQAVYLLTHHREHLGDGDLVFESPQRKPLSENAFSDRARKDGLGCHPHGFRSSFRDWAAEKSGASWAAIELSLAHAVGTTVEAAYFRTALLNERGPLMQAWADFCDPPLF